MSTNVEHFLDIFLQALTLFFTCPLSAGPFCGGLILRTQNRNRNRTFLWSACKGGPVLCQRTLLTTLLRAPVPTETITRRLLRTLLRSALLHDPLGVHPILLQLYVLRKTFYRAIVGSNRFTPKPHPNGIKSGRCRQLQFK